MSNPQGHWNRVYSTKGENEVSWYQARPEPALSLIRAGAPDKATPILDVGGGTSRLIDALIAEGYSDLTVLDVSDAALAQTQVRLGELAQQGRWITADITEWRPARQYRVWHDRAVFHFLTETAHQLAYLAALDAGTAESATVIISTFALDGPEKCSGLPVQRYSAETLADRLGPGFTLKASHRQQHIAPWGTGQAFVHAVFERRSPT